MKVYEIKEFDVLHIQRKAAIKMAKLLKVEDCELMDYPELQTIIKEKDEALYQMLIDFSSAYWNYYYFANTIRGNKIDDMEAEGLKDHMKQKDELRSALIIEIKKRKKQH